MLNISDLKRGIRVDESSNKTIEARICQDIILTLLSESEFKDNVTIKGGVVIRSLSNNFRRSTLDLDLDLISFPITNDGVNCLINKLNNNDDLIKISLIGQLKDLKHQDYQGKRAYIEIKDNFNNKIKIKLDIGVHKHISLKQIKYCFDVSTDKKGVTLFINTKEQMFTEKLTSLLRFDVNSRRYKDLYDMYYLLEHLNKKKLLNCFKVLIFDKFNSIKNISDIAFKLNKILNNKRYINRLKSSKRNWLLIDEKIIIKDILDYFDNF